MSHLNGGTLGHNPNADEAERLRVRESFNLRDHFNGAVPRPVEQAPPPTVTKAQCIEIAHFYGLEVIASNPAGGRTANIEEKYEALKIDRDSLAARVANQAVQITRAEDLARKMAERNHELAAEIMALKVSDDLLSWMLADAQTTSEQEIARRTRLSQETPNVG